MHYGYHNRFDDLPSSYQRLFAAAADFQTTEAWFRVLAATTLDADGHLRLVTAEADDGAPLALLPAVAKGRRLEGLANFYSCAFAPLLAANGAEALADSLCRLPWAVLDIPALPQDCEALPLLAKALRRRGLLMQTYFHFGNWYEDTVGLDFDTYLAQRPAILRNTLRRHEVRAARAGNVTFSVVTGGEGLEAAIADYEAVYARSWKGAEPCPAFVPELARAAAREGALRLGLAHVDGVPAAAQLWLVWRGKATIFKLAHDEAYKPLSLGSLLTARMMRQVLEADRPAEVDFGRGDDDYKKLWLSKRRERWGLRAFNPRTASGAVEALVNIGGRWGKAAFRRSCR